MVEQIPARIALRSGAVDDDPLTRDWEADVQPGQRDVNSRRCVIRGAAGEVPTRRGAAVDVEGELTAVRIGDVGDELKVEGAGQVLQFADSDRSAGVKLIVTGRR